MEPADAVHVTLDWPVAVNCWVIPNVTFAVAGVTVMGAADAVSVTFAVAVWLPALVAVMMTALVAGMVAGAVKRPLELMLPADAVQVALEEAVNCSVPPRTTLAEVGEILNVGADPNGTVMILENSEPGFFTFTGSL